MHIEVLVVGGPARRLDSDNSDSVYLDLQLSRSPVAFVESDPDLRVVLRIFETNAQLAVIVLVAPVEKVCLAGPARCRVR